jgi:hypothetical protein
MKKSIDLNKFKEVVGQLKTKQKQLQGLMNKETLKEATRYAETSRKEIQRLIRETDVRKVKTLLAKEANEIKKLQNSIPGELAKFSKFVESQRKEFEKILKTVNALEAAEFIQKKVGEKVGIKRKTKDIPVKKTRKSKSTGAVASATASVTETPEAGVSSADAGTTGSTQGV